mgnify:FL=1
MRKGGVLVDGRKHYHVEQIQSAYRRIDDKWLHMQYRLMLVLVVVATALEAGMFFVLWGLNAVETSAGWYLIKYFVVPVGCNLVLCILATILMRRSFSERKKIYGLSLLMTVMAFALYTIHATWHSLLLAFAIPMLVTVVYADQLLTGLVSGLCLVGKTVSDLLIFWDPVRGGVLDSENAFVDFILSLLLLGLFYGICAFLIRIEREKSNVSIDLERQRQKYHMESLTDALTGVWNRQALREAFRRLEDRAADCQVFLAMMDLDDFKRLNDTYGHYRGDDYLKALSGVLKAVETDRIQAFRFGGDEFCLLFYSCSGEETEQICCQIQTRFAAERVHKICQPVSVSIGIARFEAGERPSHLLQRADAALYQAKQKKGSICFKAEN